MSKNYMDKETFKALEKIMEQMEEQFGTGLDEEIERVINWMDEASAEAQAERDLEEKFITEEERDAPSPIG